MIRFSSTLPLYRLMLFQASGSPCVTRLCLESLLCQHLSHETLLALRCPMAGPLTCVRVFMCCKWQVDYTGFTTINSQRFGQRFVGKVNGSHSTASLRICCNMSHTEVTCYTRKRGFFLFCLLLFAAISSARMHAFAQFC